MASAPPYDDASEESVIRNPEIPCTKQIPGGLFPGRSILIKGIVLKDTDSKRFAVELCCGLLVRGDHQDNKVLHFNPRFDVSNSWFSAKADRDIVLNSLVNNRWGVEERYGNVFKEGEQFSLRILVLSEYFKIAVNGRHLCDYMYRVRVDDAQILFISGNVAVDSIEFQGDRPDGRPVPESSNSQQQIRRPKMPLVVPIHGGLVVGATVKITATPLMNAERFAVNFLRNNANRDHLLHVRVDFPKGKRQGAVIRNSCLEGVWQKEERQINQFPFILGVTFDMVLTAGLGHMTIEINGREFTRFTYRGDVPMKDVDRFELRGDIAVQMVQLNNIL